MTILTHLEALKFDFYEFLQFLNVGIFPNQKVRDSKIAKTAYFELLQSRN